MGMFGAAVSAAGAIGGGIIGAKSAREQKRMIQQQLADNQAWYDRRYNEDATQKADAQRILTMTEESIRNRNKQAAGAQAVMGGTDESTAAAKAANNEALAAATSNINAHALREKNNIENTYLNTKADLNKQLLTAEQAKAQSIRDAIAGTSEAGANMGL